MNALISCCSSGKHPWDTYAVEREWLPEFLRCLVIGESPGEDRSKYFYNQHRKVAVRTIMLRELSRHRLISEPTLLAFRKAGFLFDHAIRCLLPSDAIHREATLAAQYKSSRAAAATHLIPFLGEKPFVWVMGRIAMNAVAELHGEFPRDRFEISKPPYPRVLPEAPRFFVSRYLLHASSAEVAEIFRRLHQFLDGNSSDQCVLCSSFK